MSRGWTGSMINTFICKRGEGELRGCHTSEHAGDFRRSMLPAGNRTTTQRVIVRDRLETIRVPLLLSGPLFRPALNSLLDTLKHRPRHLSSWLWL